MTPEEKQLPRIHLHISDQILQDVLKEKPTIALWLKLEHLCMMESLTSKLHQLYVPLWDPLNHQFNSTIQEPVDFSSSMLAQALKFTPSN